MAVNAVFYIFKKTILSLLRLGDRTGHNFDSTYGVVKQVQSLSTKFSKSLRSDFKMLTIIRKTDMLSVRLRKMIMKSKIAIRFSSNLRDEYRFI